MYVCEGRCRPDNSLSIIRRPGRRAGERTGGGQIGQAMCAAAAAAAAAYSKKDNPRRASLMAINYQPGAARLGWGAWHCHNLSDRRDLEHLGRRGGRRVETRRRGWPGPTTDWFARFPAAEV